MQRTPPEIITGMVHSGSRNLFLMPKNFNTMDNIIYVMSVKADNGYIDGLIEFLEAAKRKGATHFKIEMSDMFKINFNMLTTYKIVPYEKFELPLKIDD